MDCDQHITKTCTSCAVDKVLKDFNKKKDGKYGVRSICRSCQNEDRREYYARTKPPAKPKSPPKSPNEIAKQHYRKNRDRILAARKKYLAEETSDMRRVRLEREKEWRKKNRDKIREKNRRDRQENPHKFAARDAKRRADVIQRTPVWTTPAMLAEIEMLYELMQFATEEAGVQYHVDHVIPLNGEKVSGLHVPSNLAVIRGEENLVKSNRYLP